ncbi:MAG: hypothetical protein HQL28_01530 [Candidatus Omnitrophica bacterium]|nr:hypothetical protein [Candidatus Omnitrophota bacterium]
MNLTASKNNILKLLMTVWVILWVVFVIRESKHGQYETLFKLYKTPSPELKMRELYGGELYDFLVFCSRNIPQGSTYELIGFPKYALNEVRARFFLWPLRQDKKSPDYKVVYSDIPVETKGDYVKQVDFNAKGALYVRKR